MKIQLKKFMQEGTPLHNSKNRCIGISIPTYPGSRIAICNTYEDGNPIATTLGWELEGKKILIIDPMTRYPKRLEEVNAPRAFYILMYNEGKELKGIHKTQEVTSLSEIVEECENCDIWFWNQKYQYYTIQENVVYNCTVEMPISESCPPHLPWAVFREINLETELNPEGYVLHQEYSLEDDNQEVVITTAGAFKRVSGPRYQKLQSQYLHSGGDFHFSWVPAEKMIVCVTGNHYCETYHVDRVEEFATTPLMTILAKVVRKLYISVGQSRFRKSNRRSTSNKMQISKTSASMREAFELGWCLRGTKDWMEKSASVKKSFADAGLDFRQYNSWQHVPYTVLDHVVQFQRAEIIFMIKKDSYSQRLFCRKYNKEDNYLAIGRAIVKHS